MNSPRKKIANTANAKKTQHYKEHKRKLENQGKIVSMIATIGKIAMFAKRLQKKLSFKNIKSLTKLQYRLIADPVFLETTYEASLGLKRKQDQVI